MWVVYLLLDHYTTFMITSLGILMILYNITTLRSLNKIKKRGFYLLIKGATDKKPSNVLFQVNNFLV